MLFLVFQSYDYVFLFHFTVLLGMNKASSTFEKINLHPPSFDRDTEIQAIENLRKLRIEDNLIGEPSTYSWYNVMKHPELLETVDPH